ncbi:hypothetical protein [Rhizobium indicum]|uniref:Uncharacterized protein n=1 Tax=Rhizobium indicum TaxID=2583231 RepID=A0ABX6PK39_9HYPH|nr:hypothetical protein [Rhizobium indicum]QKK18812.1 hypothetical protein FFM53_021150 [Rhizobium indicum]
MIKRTRRIRTAERKKRRVFEGSMEQRLRSRIDVLEQLKPEDITPELWEKMGSLEAVRNWESQEYGIQPIGSKKKYTTIDADFGGMVVLLQREINRLRPPPASVTPGPRKPLAVQLVESKLAREVLATRLGVAKKDRRRLSQELGKKTKTARAQEKLIEHYEQKIDALSQENRNLKTRLLAFEGFKAVQ